MSRHTTNYKVTHNERFNNFLLNPEYLYEDSLLFVYSENGKEVKKVIPTKAIGPYLKLRKFFRRDEDSLCAQFRGMVYEIPADIVFNY